MKKSQIIFVSIVVPTYNEEKFLPELILQLNYLTQQSKEFDKVKFEVILVDDGSTDETQKICKKLAGLYIYQTNSGKGSAVRKGVENAKGDYIVVLDADLEYLPSDILKIVDVLDGKDREIVVYGSRYRTEKFPYIKLKPYKNQSIINLYFNYFLTLLFFFRKRKLVTDLLTGLKLYPTSIYRKISPTTNGFETDHELTVALTKMEVPIKEIPISYNARTKADGKKIGYRDAIKAIKVLIK
jgi:glycosyltransferase involved in cell wall biosynthesis